MSVRNHLRRFCACLVTVLAFPCVSRAAFPAEQTSPQQKLWAELSAYPHKLAFASFINGNWEICLMNPDGSDSKNLSQHPSDDVMPHVSPDGSSILFGSDRVGRRGAGPWPIGSQGRGIFIMNLDGSNVRQVAVGEEACWAPDGRRICFLRDDYLMIKDLTTGNERRVGGFWSMVESPCWSPDGGSIALTADMLGGHNGHIFDLATGRLRRYAFGIDANCRPDFSADSKTLAFCAHTRSGVAILTVALADPRRTLRTLASRTGFNYFPDWSPDNKYIAYSHGPRNDCYEFSSGNWQIYIMTSQGDTDAPVVQLTWTRSNRDPDWVPLVATAPTGAPRIAAHD